MEEVFKSPAFVIHLPELSNRKDYFMKNITDAGWTDLRIFKGTNGRDPQEFAEALALFNNVPLDEEPSKGIFGCLFSHLRCLKHIIDEKIQLATIFEDDVSFHPQWKELCQTYMSQTKPDWDVLFIGNTMDHQQKGMISNQSCFCLHAYIVNYEGAKRLLKVMLDWDFKSFHHPKHPIVGLYNADIMVKHTQLRINAKQIPRTFTWYCWDGTYYPCKENSPVPLTGNKMRNNGLVFQGTDMFGSTASLN